MSIPRKGNVGTFADFTENPNDSGKDAEAAIQPATPGEPVSAIDITKSQRRPPENLRKRTELLRGLLDETLYLRDVDRAFGIFASNNAATVTWNGTVALGGDGKFSISHNFWLLPFNSVGNSGNTPPVGKNYGKLQLLRADNAPIIEVASNQLSWMGGDRYNVTCVPGVALSAVLTDYDLLVTVVTGVSTRLQVINAINAACGGKLLANAIAGVDGDVVKDVQAKQYIQGNWDSEAHVVTNANLVTFFGIAGNDLREGDSLCVWFASLIDSIGTGGRRQAMPELANTTVPAGSFFNSRVNPERLPNAIPVCKVINNRLVFTNGHAFVMGQATTFHGAAATDIAYGGGPIWRDGTTNPPTTVELQLDKIISDLTGTLGAQRVGFTAVGNIAANDVQAAIVELDNEKGGKALANIWTQPQTMRGNGAINSPSIIDDTSVPLGHYKLVFVQTTPSPGKARLYVGADGALYATENAEWDPTLFAGAGGWKADVGGGANLSTKVRLGVTLDVLGHKGGSATWGDTWTGDGATGWSTNPFTSNIDTQVNYSFGKFIVHALSNFGQNAALLAKAENNDHGFLIDHLGFPTQRVMEYRENWMFSASGAGAGSLDGATHWTIGGFNPSVSIRDPDGTYPHRMAALDQGNVSGNITRLYTSLIVHPSAGCVVATWEMRHTGASHRSFAAGFCYGTTIDAVSQPNNGNFAFFAQADGGNLFARSASDSAPKQETDIGAPMGAFGYTNDFYRIELYAAGHAPGGGGAKAYFYINGAAPVIHSTSVPFSGGLLPVRFMISSSTNAPGGEAADTLLVGPVHITSRLKAAQNNFDV